MELQERVKGIVEEAASVEGKGEKEGATPVVRPESLPFLLSSLVSLSHYAASTCLPIIAVAPTVYMQV
jgi:hypothetical protein